MKKLLFFGLVSFFISLYACAGSEVPHKKHCEFGVANDVTRSLYIDGYNFQFSLGPLKVENISVVNNSLNVIFLSQEHRVVFLSVKPSSADLLQSVRDEVIKSPVGDLSEVADLYGNSPFGEGLNSIYQSDNYKPFLVVETGEDVRTSRLIGNGASKDYFIHVSITPALNCDQIKVSKIHEVDERRAVQSIKIQRLVDAFLKNEDVDILKEELVGLEY